MTNNNNTLRFKKENLITESVFYNTLEQYRNDLLEINKLLNTIYIPKESIDNNTYTTIQRINILIERYTNGITERSEMINRLVEYELQYMESNK